MNIVKRNINKVVLSDLNKKMVLLAGPRQCGKTTLAKDILTVMAAITVGTLINSDV